MPRGSNRPRIGFTDVLVNAMFLRAPARMREVAAISAASMSDAETKQSESGAESTVLGVPAEKTETKAPVQRETNTGNHEESRAASSVLDEGMKLEETWSIEAKRLRFRINVAKRAEQQAEAYVQRLALLYSNAEASRFDAEEELDRLRADSNALEEKITQAEREISDAKKREATALKRSTEARSLLEEESFVRREAESDLRALKNKLGIPEGAVRRMREREKARSTVRRDEEVAKLAEAQVAFSEGAEVLAAKIKDIATERAEQLNRERSRWLRNNETSTGESVGDEPSEEVWPTEEILDATKRVEREARVVGGQAIRWQEAERALSVLLGEGEDLQESSKREEVSRAEKRSE